MKLDPVIGAITKIAVAATPQVTRQEVVIKIFKSLNFDLRQPPKDFESVYNYALVEYAVLEDGKTRPVSILKLFRDNEIKDKFWKAFTSDNQASFIDAVLHFVDSRDVGDEIIKELNLAAISDIKLFIRPYIEAFYQEFINVTRRTMTPAEVLQFKEVSQVGKNISNLSPIPPEFESLIKEKIRNFCGRKFVFEAFDEFLSRPNGYFTVIGDAGMGKSAIAAKYVQQNQAICYFNVLQQKNNRPELFLKSIRQQLINRYQLSNAEDDDLSALLVKVSQQLKSGERLVIVVDALDEVDQEPGAENILHLPKTLPEKVYFFLTRRRYEPSKKRLYTEGVREVELDLTASQYNEVNRHDIEEYIRFFLDDDVDYRAGLLKWIQDRNINRKTFVEQVAAKSENNFMYLRYVLPGIARGDYDDLNLKQLPDGLQQYYQTHWLRMKMDSAPNKLMVIILFILVEIGTPIPCEMIADIAQEDEYEVQQILNKWVEYLKQQPIDEDTCYSIYHASFLDFLKSKPILDTKRQLYKEVNQRIVDYWERENQEDDEN
ncbi:AAA family ATPase [Nostoc sp. CENA67]|uniref:AAA family ATPase n=2 Tax=Amazonocrinis TaxID=2840440 RepID=A0A8J7L674_9NOST|nr:AAA family ATPase [Amazonocrinis nigriterrae CENA67]